MPGKETEMLNELLGALCDKENQPHQWTNDPIGLEMALAKAVRLEFPDLGCPSWGRQSGGQIGGCRECFVCKLFSNL